MSTCQSYIKTLIMNWTGVLGITTTISTNPNAERTPSPDTRSAARLDLPDPPSLWYIFYSPWRNNVPMIAVPHLCI